MSEMALDVKLKFAMHGNQVGRNTQEMLNKVHSGLFSDPYFYEIRLMMHDKESCLRCVIVSASVILLAYENMLNFKKSQTKESPLDYSIKIY